MPPIFWPGYWQLLAIGGGVRRAARVDQNHGEIVRALRQAGCAVLDLSAVGRGCPDLLVSRAGQSHMIEIKFEKGSLTDHQLMFREYWKAPVHVVRSVDEAIQAVGL